MVALAEVSATILWTNKWRSSSKCKTHCIDLGLVYCSDELNGSSDGVCCDISQDCARTDKSICSLDTKSVGLAYWTCPRDPGICGSELVSIAASGESKLSLYELVAKDFKNGSICRYRLDFPYQAGYYDTITVVAKKLTNAIAYLV